MKKPVNFRTRLLAALAAFSLFASPALAQQGFTLPNNTVQLGHGLSAPVAGPPVGTNCTIAAGSSDQDGSCTATAGGPVITFATAYGTAPSCVVQDSSATPAVVYTVSTTAITITGTNAHVYFWHCAGKNGG